MKCESCEKDFPSVYYFKAKGICNECYEKLNDREKDETEPLYQAIPKITRPKPKLIGILKGLTTFAIAVLILGGVGLTLALIAGMIDPGIYRFDSFKDFGILYEIISEQPQITRVDDGLGDINLTNLAALDFTFTNRSTILLYFLSKYLILFFTLTIFYKMRQILTTLEKSDPFVRENARRIRWIGYAMIGIGGAAIIVGTIILLFFGEPIQVAGAGVKTYWLMVIRNAGDSLSSIFWGILVLIISEIFRQAVLIKEEQELTV